MKTAIIYNNIKTADHWKLRIISELLTSSDFELALLIEVETLPRIEYSFTQKVLNFQKKLEIKKVKQKISITPEILLKNLKEVPRTTLNKLDLISEYNLDIIINLEDVFIEKTLPNATRYGIWKIKHQNSFFCIVNKKESISASLEIIDNNFNKTTILEKAYCNTNWSIIKTQKLIQETSVSLLFKYLKKTSGINGNLDSFNEIAEDKYTFFKLFKYLFNFYLNIAKKYSKKIGKRLINYRYNCWTLFIGDGNFFDSELSDLKPVKLPKNEFWADPFLFNYKNELFIFFENYEYNKKKGKLSCGRVIDGKVTDVKDVLDTDYHLSFPFIFEEDGEIFLMPESNANRKLTVYKSVDFPTKWEVYATAFEGEMVADSHFYTDENNQKWLFMNKRVDISSPMDSELYIYKVDSIKMNKIEPHKMNPILIDSRVARNGGAIFKYGNNIYRPSQANISGIYGRSLNINRIDVLNINQYKEKTIRRISPDFYKGLLATHHLHQYENNFVIDAAYKKLK